MYVCRERSKVAQHSQRVEPIKPRNVLWKVPLSLQSHGKTNSSQTTSKQPSKHTQRLKDLHCEDINSKHLKIGEKQSRINIMWRSIIKRELSSFTQRSVWLPNRLHKTGIFSPNYNDTMCFELKITRTLCGVNWKHWTTQYVPNWKRYICKVETKGN